MKTTIIFYSEHEKAWQTIDFKQFKKKAIINVTYFTLKRNLSFDPPTDSCDFL